jgi:hypothetical protein
MFDRFLTHKYHIDLSRMMLQKYPELQKCIKAQDRSQCIVTFVEDLHKKHSNELEIIAQHARSIVAEHGTTAFKLLGQYMEWQWPRNTRYIAYLSFLQGSPFNAKTGEFWYSILAELDNKNEERKNLLSVGIHEISHMIFLRQLADMGITLQRDTLYILKETLTIALMGQPELVHTLDIADPPKGNYELHELFVEWRGRKMGIVAMVAEYMNNFHDTYHSRLTELTQLFSIHAKEWQVRMELWRKYGKMLYSDPKLLKEYQIPIIL